MIFIKYDYYSYSIILVQVKTNETQVLIKETHIINKSFSSLLL